MKNILKSDMKSDRKSGDGSIDTFRRPYSLVLLYLLFEFGRPQGIIPALNPLRLPGIVTLFMIYNLFRYQKFSLYYIQTKLYLFLLFIMGIHIIFALNGYWAFNTFLVMTLSFCAYLSIISFVDTQDKYNKLTQYWIYIHIFLAIFGIAKNGRGIGGFLADENDFCMTINMVIPFSYYMTTWEKPFKKKLFYAITTGLFVFANMISFSRGGFVGMLGVGSYIWIKSSRKVFTLLAIATMVVLMILIAPAKYGDRLRSITQEGSESGTGAERVYTWGIAWEMFKGNPLFGVGQGNAPWEFRKYEIKAGFKEGFFGRSRAGRAMHSIYFTMLPELGMVGTFLIGGMIFYCFKDTNRIRDQLRIRANTRKTNATNNATTRMNRYNKNNNTSVIDYSAPLQASLIGYLVSSIFISTLYYPNFWILMGFIVCLVQITCAANEEHSSSH
jgi:hypothetical protein